MNPVFIIGCQRSGTTFLGSIMGAHEQCLCTPESQFIIEPIKKEFISDNRYEAINAINDILNNWRFKIWNLDIKSSDLVPFKNYEKSYINFIEWIVMKYGNKIGKNNFKLWIDHTPGNVNYVDYLKKIYPKAKFIHIIRDGRAVASSVKKLDWGISSPIRLARFWITRIAHGMTAETILPTKKILRVKYEDLLINPEQQIKIICSFLNIDFQHKMIIADGFQVPSFTYDQHLLVGKKPQTDRINAWQKDLKQREIEIFEFFAGRLLAYFNYKPIYDLCAKPPTFFEDKYIKINDFVKRKRDKRRVLRRINKYTK